MKISIILNDYPKSYEVAELLTVKLMEAGFIIDDQRPDIVISIGGDGTMLRAFHNWQHLLDEVRFIGVHTGHLGFYTDWRDYEINELVQSLQADQGDDISYPLLEVTITKQNQQQERFLALNESTVRQINKTMVANVWIQKQKFECFRGDGLSIATPTGSTGYNRSVGGAVMSPYINTLQMTEIASLNSRGYRTLGAPVIIGANDEIVLEIKDDSDHIITIDQKNLILNDVQTIKYKVAKQRIKFAKYRHMNFWERVKEAFIEDET